MAALTFTRASSLKPVMLGSLLVVPFLWRTLMTTPPHLHFAFMIQVLSTSSPAQLEPDALTAPLVSSFSTHVQLINKPECFLTTVVLYSRQNLIFYHSFKCALFFFSSRYCLARPLDIIGLFLQYLSLLKLYLFFKAHLTCTLPPSSIPTRPFLQVFPLDHCLSFAWALQSTYNKY